MEVLQPTQPDDSAVLGALATAVVSGNAPDRRGPGTEDGRIVWLRRL